MILKKSKHVEVVPRSLHLITELYTATDFGQLKLVSALLIISINGHICLLYVGHETFKQSTVVGLEWLCNLECFCSLGSIFSPFLCSTMFLQYVCIPFCRYWQCLQRRCSAAKDPCTLCITTAEDKVIVVRRQGKIKNKGHASICNSIRLASLNTENRVCICHMVSVSKCTLYTVFCCIFYWRRPS